jgi:LysR family glycine cleavage system transcriptional activator
VAISPRHYLSEDLASGRIVIPLPQIAQTGIGMYLICDPQKADTRPLRDFRDWIRTACAADQQHAYLAPAGRSLRREQ